MRLGWWEGKTFRTVPDTLCNLSISGALLKLEDDAPHPPTREVWMTLGGAAALPWVRAEIVDCHECAGASCCKRLRFAEPFPYEAFKAAVWGGTAKRRADDDPGNPSARAAPVPAGADKTEAGRERPSELDRIRFFLGIGDDQELPSPLDRLPDPGAFPDRLSLVGARHEQMVLADRLSWITWLFGFMICLLMICFLAIVARMRYETVLKLAIMLGLDG
jgi:hypothetical protein